jgi:hypothetical protein
MTQALRWSVEHLDARGPFLGVSGHRERVAIVGGHGTIRISDDGGARFERADMFPLTVFTSCLVEDGGVTVLGHLVLHSATGAGDWERHVLLGYKTLRAVTASGGIAMAVGDGAYRALRRDGERYTPVLSKAGTGKDLRGVAALGELFVAVGHGGVAVARTPALGWQKEQTGTKQDLLAACRDGAEILAVGAGGTMLRRDADGWRPLPALIAATLRGCARGPLGCFAVGDDGVVLRSSDGARFGIEPVPTTARLNAVWCGEDLVVAVGEGGVVLRGRPATLP